MQPSNMEECDDGNLSNIDRCVGSCKLAKCGDAFVQNGAEQCDDGNQVNTDPCTNMCKNAACGDSFVQPGEGCDDGNLINTDACTAMCKPAVCGDAIVQAGVEQCDDGNLVNTDACVAGCKAAKCGDGFVLGGTEQCDDGNAANNDGCSSSCLLEEGAPCGGVFKTVYCLQVGTMQQFTKCESVQNGGKTCINPEIKYGNVPGGVPAQHVGNDFPKWCQQLGFAGWSGQVSYGNRPCLSPKGKLFGWTGYDEPGWHWCDWQDGVWYNQALNYQQCNDGAEITSITCQ